MSDNNEIFDTVSLSGGRIKLDALKSAFHPTDVEAVVRNGTSLDVTTDVNGVVWVETRLGGLKLCSRHCSGSDCIDPSCCDLHMCKFYALNKCTYGNEKCKFGHDLHSRHNQAVLKRCGEDTISLSRVQTLLRNHRTEVTLPTACKFYNNEGGCTKRTTGNKACTHLHVCRFFLDNTCKFGSDCKRSHDLVTEEHTRRILTQFGIFGSSSQEMVKCFQIRRPSEKPGITSRLGALSVSPQPAAGPPVSPNDDSCSGISSACRTSPRAAAAEKLLAEEDSPKPDVCIYYLNGKCNYGEKCTKCHCPLPFQWQIAESEIWQDCSNELNADLENQFCTSSGPVATLANNVSVNFNVFTLASGDRTRRLRRLGTVPFATHELRPFASRWVWLWEDYSGTWRLYGDKGESGRCADVTSDKVEDGYVRYLAGCASTLSFAAGSQNYRIDFRCLKQENIATGVKRRLWRRPSTLVSTQAFVQTRNDWHRRTIPLPKVPATWEEPVQAFYRDIDMYNLIAVQSYTGEYRMVLDLFKMAQMPCRLLLVQRIQNSLKWAEYLRRETDSSTTCEKLLFHRADEDEISGICQQGFEGRESSGACGRGIYFHAAPDVATQPGSKGCHKVVVVAKVAVGSFAMGRRDYWKPPPVNPFSPSDGRYDSVCDDDRSPGVYVVFDESQCYPAYLARYE